MPFNTSSRLNQTLVWSVGLYIILVFNFLEPFGITIRSFIPEYHLVLSTYGLISSLTMALLVYVIHPWISENWFKSKTINAIWWFIFAVFILSISNWLYSYILHDIVNGWRNMYVMDRRFLVLMPKFFILFSLWAVIALINLYILNLNKSDRDSKPHVLEETLTLHSDNQSDKFKVNALHLICFKTCDNYLEIYYIDETKTLKNRLIRSSMKKIEEQLNITQFYRCHQSYLINLAYVKGLKKVKNTHFLEIAYLDFYVSISRKNLKNIKTFLLN